MHLEIGNKGGGKRDHNINFFVDAAQSAGKIHIDVDEFEIDFLSFSSHKIYGPKGIGCLYVRDGSLSQKFDSQIHGGGQEKNYRSGTLNVPGIVGFGKACELAYEYLDIEQERISGFRDKIFNSFKQRLSKIALLIKVIVLLSNLSY